MLTFIISKRGVVLHISEQLFTLWNKRRTLRTKDNIKGCFVAFIPELSNPQEKMFPLSHIFQQYTSQN
jgi:hypothetical protein